jgi:predicted nucleic acid-binding protein
VTVVVDTSVLVDHLRGHDAARTLLAGLVDDGVRLAGSVLTRTEVLAGLRPPEEAGTTTLLRAVEWVPVDATIADLAGALAREWLPSHAGIDTVDYVIAATAHQLGAKLLTLNVRHFPMFAGLRPAY